MLSQTHFDPMERITSGLTTLTKGEQNMKQASWLAAFTVVCLFIAPLTLGPVFGQAPPSKTADILSKGKMIYEKRCVACHGAQGDGQTPIAPVLKPAPRDFTQPLANWAVSKGDPAAIFKTIKEGIPNSSMVNFSLPDEDIWALVYTVMSFSREKKSQYKAPLSLAGIPLTSIGAQDTACAGMN